MPSLYRASAFDTPPVAPIIGRGIVDDDAPVVAAGQQGRGDQPSVLTRMFNADPPPSSARDVPRVETIELQVIGVMPEGFGGFVHIDTAVDFYAPPDTISRRRKHRRPVATQLVGSPPFAIGATSSRQPAQLASMWPQVRRPPPVMRQKARRHRLALEAGSISSAA